MNQGNKTVCKKCGAEVSGKYCSECGKKGDYGAWGLFTYGKPVRQKVH